MWRSLGPQMQELRLLASSERVPSMQGRRPGLQGSPLLSRLHTYGQGGHGGDCLGFFILALLGFDQGVGHGGGEALQGAPVLAWAREVLGYRRYGTGPSRLSMTLSLTLAGRGMGNCHPVWRGFPTGPSKTMGVSL